MPISALIVDDSSVMRKIVERSLRQAGIDLTKVLEAGNGAEALVALRDNTVDLILCDINMPVMGRMEFIKQLPGWPRKRRPGSHDYYRRQRVSCGRGLIRGARGYIRKPFTAEQVKEHVVPVLAGKS